MHIESAIVQRLNQVNIQLLPASLQSAIFPDAPTQPSLDERVVELARAHLCKHELPIDTVRPALDEPDFKIPPLEGKDIEEHFWMLGSRLSADYVRVVEEWMKNGAIVADGRFEPGHFKWDLNAPGWTAYDPVTGESIGPMKHPPVEKEPLMIFDVETARAYTGGKAPLLAVAMGKSHLYAWISPQYLSGEDTEFSRETLIPFGPASSPSLLIGHNVSYDRARIFEEYEFEPERMGERRFLDTLSMHSAIGGISSQQRMTWTKYKKDRDRPEDEIETEGQDETPVDEYGLWCAKGSMANLQDTLRLHCDGMALDKAPRQLLMKCEDPVELRSALPLLLDYCSNDVAATGRLFRMLWPKFLAKCPHPVSFAALVEMGTCYLPVDRRWPEYVQRCETMLEEAKSTIEEGLASLAARRVSEYNEEKAAGDPWMARLDWTPTPARFTKPKLKKDGSYAKDGEPRPIGNSALFGMPAWLRKLWDTKKGGVELTTRARIVPYLLRMSWEGRPVHFIPSVGWCYGIPAAESIEGSEFFTDEAAPGWHYFRIPHAKSQGANVGCLLSKDYLAAFEKGILTTPEDSKEIVKKVLEQNTRFSFWTGYRERVSDQLVVWTGPDRGAILPQSITMGTVTRRAVEPTWMTASNPKPGLVGSELKAMVVAPPGFSLVGADVDSQELWIASLLGDAQFGFAGATAIAWMTLQGTKSDGTDLHSRTAKLLGMTRDAAKIFTYGRIYGAGANYAAQLLQKYDASLDAKMAGEKARTLYHATKGRRGQDGVYVGGTESFMFNQLEAIARAPVSRTPALGAAISDALLSSSVQEDFLTSRINWAVQSSGVDYLHMLLVAMRYLLRRHAIPARLLLTIHDEVRYIVREEDALRLASCLQIANLWTRAMFVHRLGMRELPLSVAFFAAIDVDRVLRKEPTVTCQTPSHPEAIAPGRSLDIYGLLKEIGPDGGLGPVDPKFSTWWRSKSLLLPTRTPPKTLMEPSVPVSSRSLTQLQRQAGIMAKKRTEAQRTDTQTNSNSAQVSSGAEAKTLNKWKSLLNRKPTS